MLSRRDWMLVEKMSQVWVVIPKGLNGSGRMSGVEILRISFQG